MRIAIVNDLAIAVEALRRAVRAVPESSVAWVARDGAEAIELCAADRPDLILMDLVMPGVDGVAATHAIMQRSPCPILIVTASVRGNVAKVFEALGSGALDVVATPRLGLSGGLEGTAEFARKIATVRALVRHAAPRARDAEPARTRRRTTSPASGQDPTRPGAAAATAPAGRQRVSGAARAPGVPPLVAIGASTGGPQALATILSDLPRDLPAAIAVVQHIDGAFAPGLAHWLARRTRLSVAPLSGPERLDAGHVWVAAGDGHLVLGDDLTLHLSAEPSGTLHCPSIDVFFESAAARLRRGCGVLLTGMGNDGARGLVALRRAGFRTIAQDEATSVVWGMPRAAAEHGGATDVLPLPRIAEQIVAHVTAMARRTAPTEDAR